ncbi:MAG: hypothetical protein E2O66_05645 [Deltaproteobacteria bacterium]|nr:hypothetical protein [Myxococcales bacterium]MCH8132727.1 hypothetical protein [Myxococcales bacterium]TDJ13214.1 MAG: hypothetical protein E2O66_05645 [Deltaproteobacteria bacterium]TDJ21558.1 MAG: hypothetical protein E2O69_01445 [Deltaproteobacteria bacterium]
MAIPSEPVEASIAPVVRAGPFSFARMAPLFLRDPIDFFEKIHARFGPTVMFERPTGGCVEPTRC